MVLPCYKHKVTLERVSEDKSVCPVCDFQEKKKAAYTLIYKLYDQEKEIKVPCKSWKDLVFAFEKQFETSRNKYDISNLERANYTLLGDPNMYCIATPGYFCFQGLEVLRLPKKEAGSL